MKNCDTWNKKGSISNRNVEIHVQISFIQTDGDKMLFWP